MQKSVDPPVTVGFKVRVMDYTIQELATLAGVSVRTLHHYDEIGLLQPQRNPTNGYRRYGEAELLKLQQILFFRELEFPLGEIRRILEAPNFDPKEALKSHRAMLELKQKRLADLVDTIDKTLHSNTMTDQDYYGGFSQEEMDKLAQEAKERWGNTEAYKQSAERTKHWKPEDYKRIAKEGEDFMRLLVTKMPEGARSEAVQAMIAQHYASLRTFYEPSAELYLGLATMYTEDARFRAYFEKFDPALPEFMRDAMEFFVAEGGPQRA